MEDILHTGLAVAIFLVFGSPMAVCHSDELTIKTELIEGKYCAEQPGNLSFRANVRFTYHNIGQHSILLALFDQVAEYSLFPDKESLLANRAEGQERFRLRRLFDATKLDQTRPHEGLFRLIEPGGLQTRIHEILIVLRPPRRPGISLLGADHYLRIEINHWFETRENGEKLQHRWRDFGLLWIDNVISQPLKIHIEKDPVPQRCQDRVD